MENIIFPNIACMMITMVDVEVKNLCYLYGY